MLTRNLDSKSQNVRGIGIFYSVGVWLGAGHPSALVLPLILSSVCIFLYPKRGWLEPGYVSYGFLR